MSGVSTARAEAQQLIARVDSKASLLLAFNGVALAGLWTAGSAVRPDPVAVVAGVAAGLLLVASTTVALWTVRPRLGDGGSGFPLWASLPAADLETALAADSEATHVVALSRIVIAKMRGFRRAVDLTLGALGAALAAGAAEAIGRL